MIIYCECKEPLSCYMPELGNFCMLCFRSIKVVPKYGSHTYRERYSTRKCEVCGEVKNHRLHSGYREE